MTDLVPVTPDTDLSDLRLERTANGHVVSPFFTYDYEKYHRGPVYEIWSHFHSVRFRSIAAFAQALGIDPNEVVVSEIKDQVNGALKWRLGTQRPCKLPDKPALTQAERMHAIQKLIGDAESPVIDI